MVLRGNAVLGVAAVVMALLGGAPADAAEDALRVELVQVRRAPIVTPFELTGTIEAVDSVDLGFREGGRVSQVLVDVGDRVKAGDALARLDSVQQTQALNVAQAGLASAQAGEAQARQASERASALLERGVGTEAARDQAAEALSQAEGALKSAQSTVEQAARALDDTVLRAPYDAIVTARDLAPGQVVSAAQGGLSLASLAGFEAQFRAADLAILDAAIGARVDLTSIDMLAEPMVGRVTEVSPLVDPEDGTVAVTVAIADAPELTRLLGSAVLGTVEIAQAEGLVVPWTALMRKGAGSAVWRVGPDGTVEMVPVDVLQFSDTSVYLQGGVAEGDLVVGAGSQMLYPGRAVVDAAAPDGTSS